jgi:GLPGLI family protein
MEWYKFLGLLMQPILIFKNMKKIIRIITLISCINLLKSQTVLDSSKIEIRYNFTFVQDTLDITSTISEPMILLTNGKKSVYYSENYQININGLKEQLDIAKKNNAHIIDLNTLPRAKVRHSVYKNETETYISNYLGNNFLTFKHMTPLDWKIDNKSIITIAGYKCTKATLNLGKKKFIAWFTYDIPISDGPYKFRGLPGLILELNDLNNFIRFEASAISKKKLPIELKKGILITQQQYINKRNEYMDDPSQGKINTPEYRKKTAENRKRFNNSLEY